MRETTMCSTWRRPKTNDGTTSNGRDKTPRPASSPVRFCGPWSHDEQSRVEAAARSTDGHAAAATASHQASAWVCLCVRLDRGTYYLAHWARRPEVLTARTVDELVEKMRHHPYGAGPRQVP